MPKAYVPGLIVGQITCCWRWWANGNQPEACRLQAEACRPHGEPDVPGTPTETGKKAKGTYLDLPLVVDRVLSTFSLLLQRVPVSDSKQGRFRMRIQLRRVRQGFRLAVSHRRSLSTCQSDPVAATVVADVFATF